jgi:hypothetical protein
MYYSDFSTADRSQAANRMSAIRTLILDSLDALSYPIDDTAPYFYIYAWNETLLQRTHELYVTILDAVVMITEWIEKSKGGTLFWSPHRSAIYPLTG